MEGSFSFALRPGAPGRILTAPRRISQHTPWQIDKCKIYRLLEEKPVLMSYMGVETDAKELRQPEKEKHAG